MAKRARIDVIEPGFGSRDTAPESFLTCPRCAASATVLHVEPKAGGGICRHEHRCTRCRHEWEAEPASWRLCPLPACDVHGLDATSLGGHLETVELALDIQAPVRAEVIGRVLKDFGLTLSSEADLHSGMAVIRAARSAVGGETRLAVAWFHNRNAALGDTPATVMAQPGGTDRLRDYLMSRHVPMAD